MMLTGDAEGFARLTAEIAKVSGMQLGDYKEKVLRRRIAVRMRACGVENYGDYGARLKGDAVELEKLKDALTINVTRLYRNPETWDKVRHLVLPDLIKKREAGVKVWSAGCSSGEEPYTLAICLAEEAERAGRATWATRSTILATDIDEIVMAKARAGKYPIASFLEMPKELATKYFRGVGADDREVVPAIKRMVEVRRQDLLREAAPGSGFDLVVCRNVVIYFDRDGQERLFERFANSLAPGGYFLLGKVETLIGPARDMLELVDVRERIYRRPS
jgi:chemotaxis methyl-accepting protein methylase